MLDVRRLDVSFSDPSSSNHAVRGVSYSLFAEQTYGLAGESGCGKTTSARALLGLLSSASVTGELVLASGDRYDLSDQGAKSRTLAPLRGQRIALTFQEPTAALDPLRRIGAQIGEASRARGHVARQRARDLLSRMGFANPDVAARAYPHLLSGGMLQRAALALAVACEPDVLVADEPTTALDTILQERILELLRDIGRDTVRAIELISHDLAVLGSCAHRIGIMYAGRIVEEAPARELLASPVHPYSCRLISLARALEHRTAIAERVVGAQGEVVREGCSFAPRCPRRAAPCATGEPDLVEVSPGHRAACWQAGGVDT